MVRAGIKVDKEQQGFHRLRHTYATRLRKMKVPTEDIQVLMGHTNITTTQIYAKPDETNLAEYVNRIA
jgi:integrase